MSTSGPLQQSSTHAPTPLSVAVLQNYSGLAIFNAVLFGPIL
jgi:hypothetical protein